VTVFANKSANLEAANSFRSFSIRARKSTVTPVLRTNHMRSQLLRRVCNMTVFANKSANLEAANSFKSFCHGIVFASSSNKYQKFLNKIFFL